MAPESVAGPAGSLAYILTGPVLSDLLENRRRYLLASRSHTTFKKRQKEQARAEKQRAKAAKRMQRKLEKRLHTGDDAADDEAVSPSTPPSDGLD